MFMPGNPQRSCHTYRRVRTTDKSYQHNQSKILCGFPTKEVQRGYAEKNRSQCIAASAESLADRIIGQNLEAVCTSMRMNIFTNTVKDYDRFIHGVTKYRQNGGKE